MFGWERKLGSHSFMPFLKLCHIRYHVRFTANSLLCWWRLTALCAVRHPVRKCYYYVDTSKYSTASCAPCPHCTFLPAYIRTPVCTGRSDLNDDFLARCKRLWQTHGWVIAHVKGGRANAYPHPRMLDSLSAYRHLVSNPWNFSDAAWSMLRTA